MFDFLSGWLSYPVAELSHIWQGALCGWLGTRAIFKKEISDAIVSLLLLIGFAIYEITEQWAIGDKAYLDFENFWIFAVFTGLIYLVIHMWRNRNVKRPTKD